MVVSSSPVGMREASSWNVSTRGSLAAAAGGASMWTVPVRIVKPGVGVLLEVRVIVTAPPVGVVAAACTGSLAVAPVAPVSVLREPPGATLGFVTVLGSSMQFASQPSPAVTPPSSHSSTPVCTTPSPHTLGLQSFLQASMLLVLPSSHCSQPGSALPSPQTAAFPPVQMPVRQVSVCVHAFPSSQVVPSGAWGFEHVPFTGLHVPTRWHWSSAVHTTGFVPAHDPLWQVSVCVQASLSSQGVPFGRRQVSADSLQRSAHWPP